METQPRRRWFAFSLRTLLIMVALAASFCGWIGWEAKRVRNRQILRWMILRDFEVKIKFYSDDDSPLPFHRKLVGDRSSIQGVIIRTGHWTAETITQVKEAFPEAKVLLLHDDNSIFLDDEMVVPPGPIERGF